MEHLISLNWPKMLCSCRAETEHLTQLCRQLLCDPPVGFLFVFLLVSASGSPPCWIRQASSTQPPVSPLPCKTPAVPAQPSTCARAVSLGKAKPSRSWVIQHELSVVWLRGWTHTVDSTRWFKLCPHTTSAVHVRQQQWAGAGSCLHSSGHCQAAPALVPAASPRPCPEPPSLPAKHPLRAAHASSSPSLHRAFGHMLKTSPREKQKKAAFRSSVKQAPTDVQNEEPVQNSLLSP